MKSTKFLIVFIISVISLLKATDCVYALSSFLNNHTYINFNQGYNIKISNEVYDISSQKLDEPLDGISKIITWFNELNNSFDDIVKREKKAQLLRNINALRKDSYKLEIDTRFFLESIPDSKPDEQQWAEIQINLRDLFETLESLRHHIRRIGADLRFDYQSTGQDVELALRTGINSRAGALTYTKNQLSEMYRGTIQWNPSDVRQRVQKALIALREAQIAITKLQKRLESERS